MKKFYLPDRGLIKPTRRKFITGVTALLAAPHVAKAQLSMTGVGGGFNAGGGSLGLQTNLGSFFSLDNTLADATGNVTNLTNNNSVTFVSSTPSPIAAVSNTAKFVQSSSQYLSHVDATGINVAGINFSLQFWFWDNSNGADITCKGANSFGNNEYRVERPFASVPKLEINNAGTLDATGSFPNNVWRHFVFTFNNTTKGGIMYIDGVSVGTKTWGSGAVGTGDLRIGSNYGTSGFWNGNLCLYGTWRNRILSAGDVTLLYNSGNGLSYAAMA